MRWRAQALEEQAEDLVEVLACYFPIVYTPPTPAPPGTIERAQLVAGVQGALVAVPAFAPHALPMFLEKLASSLRWGLSFFVVQLSAGYAMSSATSQSIWGLVNCMSADLQAQLQHPAC